MTKNNTNTPWYPKSGYKNYAYVEGIKNEELEELRNVYSIASGLLNEAHRNIQSTRTINKSYSQLRALAAREREAEISFLRTYYKTDFDESSNFTEILTALNQLLQDKQILQDSLDYIERVTSESDSSNQKSALYSLLNYTIPSAIEKFCNEFISEELDLNESLEDNIERMSKKLYDRLFILLEEELQKEIKKTNQKPFENLYNILSGQLKNDFVRQVFEGYGLTPTQLLNNIKTRTKTNNQTTENLFKLNHYSTQKRAGNVFEFFSEQLFSAAAKQWSVNNKDIKITVQHTGQLGNMKADQILYVGETEIDLNPLIDTFQNISHEIHDRSARIRNIEGLKAMLKTLDESTKFIVEISDKNYNLTSNSFAKNHPDYGGFAAGNANLEILQKVLGRTYLPKSNLENLIFILANSGDYMINKRNVEDATRLIALNVGIFLFDDVAIKESLDGYKSSNKRLHVFNLNGVLVPLSIFLQAAADAFEKNQEELENYVKVKFHSSRTPWPNSNGKKDLTEQDWNDFYNIKIRSNSVTVKFFGDFTNFIKTHMIIKS